MRDEKSILPVSHMIHGVYDIDGVALSMPAIVGANGVESDIPINLNGEEALKLKESADALKKIIETIELWILYWKEMYLSCAAENLCRNL